ncbi:MAG TPA: MFS transporter [Candidatus Limnocylindrales bacterium]|nr:MFS transporter [Candidatus Limnocylindrales bacterium]
MADELAIPAPEAPALEGTSLFQPLRLRDFRLVFAGETISLVGDQFHFIALAWLTLQLTSSGLALGSVLMVAAVPRAIFMLAGGALSDRLSPRSLMLWSNVIRGIVVAIVATLVLTGTAELWHLFVLALVFGTVDALFYPAINTIVPMLVGERLLPPANALIQGIQQLAGLIGPAAAGVLVAAVNTGPAFVIDAISFGAAATALVFVAGGRRRPAEAATDVPPERLLSTIATGMRYVWTDSPVRSLVLLSAAINLGFTGPIGVGGPYRADVRFEGGSAAFGIIASGFGAGALAGAVVAGSLRYVPRLGTLTGVIMSGLGIGLALLGSAPNVPVAVAVATLIGLGVGFTNVRVIAWLQARTPEQLRGRVMSVVMLGSVGLAPISLAASGVIIDVGAVTLLFWLAGGLIVAAAGAGFLMGLPRQMLDTKPAG